MLSDGALIAIITSVVGPVAGVIFVWLRDRRRSLASAHKEMKEAGKVAAEGEATLASVTLEWAKSLKGETDTLKAEVSELRKELSALRDDLSGVRQENRLLRKHNEMLSAQVMDLGGKPLPMPEW